MYLFIKEMTHYLIVGIVFVYPWSVLRAKGMYL